MPSGRKKGSLSLNGSTSKMPLPASQTIAGQVSSSMVLQTEKPKAMPSKPGIARLEPSRTPISSTSSKKWSAA